MKKNNHMLPLVLIVLGFTSVFGWMTYKAIYRPPVSRSKSLSSPILKAETYNKSNLKETQLHPSTRTQPTTKKMESTGSMAEAGRSKVYTPKESIVSSSEKVPVSETSPDTTNVIESTQEKSQDQQEKMVDVAPEMILNDLRDKLYNGDSIDVAWYAEYMASCPDCLAMAAQALEDPSANQEFRLLMAEILIQSGAENGVGSVVRALYASDEYDNEFKERLRQSLTAVNLPSQAKTLAEIYLQAATPGVEGSHQLDLETMAKAVREVPDQEVVGDLLLNFYQNGNEQERQALIEIGHPQMLGLLSAENYRTGDLDNSKRFDSLLAQNGSSGSYRAIVNLSKLEEVPLPSLGNLSFAWAENNPDQARQEDLSASLAGGSEDAREQVVAAYAIAAVVAPGEAQEIVTKALENSDNETVINELEVVLDLLDNVKKTTENDDGLEGKK